MIRIGATIVFMLFMLMAGYAVTNLGFAWPGLLLVFALTGALLWEIWIQPARDEAYRQEILSDIENFKEMLERANPTNLQDAKDTIKDLSTQLDIVSDAYVELKDQPKEKE